MIHKTLSAKLCYVLLLTSGKGKVSLCVNECSLDGDRFRDRSKDLLLPFVLSFGPSDIKAFMVTLSPR